MTFHHFRVRTNLVPPANSCLLNTALQEVSLADPSPVTERPREGGISLLSSNTNRNAVRQSSYYVYILHTCAYVSAYAFPHTPMTEHWTPRPSFGKIPSQVNIQSIYCSLRTLVINLAYCDNRSPGIAKPLPWGVVLGRVYQLCPPLRFLPFPKPFTSISPFCPAF